MPWFSLMILLSQNTIYCINNSKQKQGHSVLKKKTLAFSQCLITEIASLGLYQYSQYSTSISTAEQHFTNPSNFHDPASLEKTPSPLGPCQGRQTDLGLGPTGEERASGTSLQMRSTHLPAAVWCVSISPKPKTHLAYTLGQEMSWTRLHL